MAEGNRKPLIFGFALVVIGVLLLLVNVYGLRLPWFRFSRFVIPALLLLWGLTKLVRHFTWPASRLRQYPRRASLLGGLFWSSLGAISILHMLQQINGWEVFALYWPALVILFGLGKVVDFYRVGMGSLRFAEIVGLIFIGLCGGATYRITHTHLPLLDWDWGNRGWWNPSAWGADRSTVEHSWTTYQEVSTEGLSILAVANLYGDVSVQGEERTNALVTLEKVVLGIPSQEEARKVADQIRLRVQRQQDSTLLAPNRRELPGRYRFKTHLTLQVPAQLQLKVNNAYGKVQVEGMKGASHLENSLAEIVVRQCEGPLTVANRYADVTVRQIVGPVKVSNHRGDIRIRNVKGRVEAENAGDSLLIDTVEGDVQARTRSGQVEIKQVKGKVRVEAPVSSVTVAGAEGEVWVESSYKAVTVEDVPSLSMVSSYNTIRVRDVGGPLRLNSTYGQLSGNNLRDVQIQAKGSRISLSRLEGELRIVNTLREVSLQEVQGFGEIQNENAPIDLEVRRLTGPLTLRNQGGRVSLYLPAQADCRVSVQAPGGEIRSDFGEVPSSSLEVLTFQLGEGENEVRLQVPYCRVQIRQGQKRGSL